MSGGGSDTVSTDIGQEPRFLAVSFQCFNHALARADTSPPNQLYR
jgi:hypothetical protein